MINTFILGRVLGLALVHLLGIDLMTTAPTGDNGGAKHARTVAVRPTLRTGPSSVAHDELVRSILKANERWLERQMSSHSYVFSMQHTNKADCWEAVVEFDRGKRLFVFPGPNSTEVFPPRQEPLGSFHYEEQMILLQGVDFFGPLHQLARLPAKYRVRSLGDAKLHGIAAWVLHLRTAKLGDAADPPWPLPPDYCLSILFGCGLWSVQYGGGSNCTEVDQVWVEKATNRPLREEGFTQGQCCFLIEYGDYEKVSENSAVPCHVVLTFFPPPVPRGSEDIYPWKFDMEFAVHGGKVWLLKQLIESWNGKIGATADVRDVKLTKEPNSPRRD